MNNLKNEFSHVDTNKELRIAPYYYDHQGIVTPVDLGLDGIDLSLVISPENAEVLNITRRLEIFDNLNGGAISHCMECISATAKGEKLVSTMLEVEKLDLLTDHLKSARTDINAAIDRWLLIGKTINREVSYIWFDWYDVDKRLEKPTS